jgi:hypothetical protein
MNNSHEIKENQSIELLKELHILTRDGKLNQDSKRKLKQVYHLFNFIEPLINTFDKDRNFYLVDHGAGKSYLGFLIFDLYLKSLKNSHVIGIENREELVKKSVDLAKKLNFSRMQFHHLSVKESITTPLIPNTVDMVTALHACDTATDDAIDFALHKKSKFIVLIPCCQAQVASILRKIKNQSLAKTFLTQIWRHPIHTREFGSHITNVLRCLRLEKHGYQVTVTELVGWEHSMKNELIIAEYKGTPNKKSALDLQSISETIGIPVTENRFIT